jgi:hypothetical protein
MFLGPIPRKDFSDFLKKKFLDGGYSPSDEAITAILDLAEDVPYNVQMLAHSCWSRMRDEGTNRSISKPFIEETLAGIVRQQDPFYTQLWTSLTPIQQQTLLAVVEQGGVNLQSTRTSQSIGRGPGTIRKSLQSMIESGILREDLSIRSSRMRFEDPFFARWIQMTAMRIA